MIAVTRCQILGLKCTNSVWVPTLNRRVLLSPFSALVGTNKKPTIWWGYAKRRATKIRPKAVVSGIFGRFSNFDKCRLEAAGDVISGLAIELAGTDVSAKFAGSRLNSGRIIRLIGLPYPFYALLCGV